MTMNSRQQSPPLTATSSPVVFDLISRDELQRLCVEQGLSDAEIAQRYNVSTNQVHRRRQQMNLIHGERTSTRLAQIVQLSERIKALPDEAITEIEAIVNRYQQSLH